MAFQSCGRDCFISPHAIIRRPHLVSLGDCVDIDPWVYISTAARVGSYVHIAVHSSVIGGEDGLLVMGSFTNLAAGCRVVCKSDKFTGGGLIGGGGVPGRLRDFICDPVVLEDFANVGTGSILLPGVVMREGSALGAGGLLLAGTATEPWTIYAGRPARPVAKRPKETMLRLARELGYAKGGVAP